VQLNEPLVAAVEALPKDALKRWDEDTQAIAELCFGWMDSGNRNPSQHPRYIFGHSVLRAALAQECRGQLAQYTARIAATELEMLIVKAIEDDYTEFAMMTGHDQLKQFGEMLGDYKILAAAEAWSLYAQRNRPADDEFHGEVQHALQEMTRGKLVNFIQHARSQRTYNAVDSRALDQYEKIAESVS
jgi:hypothetical protein